MIAEFQHGGSGGRRLGLGRARSDMHHDEGLGLLTRSEEWVPSPGIQRWQSQPERDLGEADRPTVTLGVATYLGCCQVGIPQGDESRPQQVSPGSTWPILEQPVVVRLKAEQREVLVGGLEETLTAEPKKDVWKTQGDVDAIGGHVLDAGLALIEPRPHLFVGRRNPLGLDRRPARRCVPPEDREPDIL